MTSGARMAGAATQLSFPTRPSFSTAHRKRPFDLSHLRKTLKPGVPVLPLLPASFDTVGQWPVCCAGASPTEDPCHKQLDGTHSSSPIVFVNAAAKDVK